MNSCLGPTGEICTPNFLTGKFHTKGFLYIEEHSFSKNSKIFQIIINSKIDKLPY